MRLNNVTTADDYVDRCTVRAPGATSWDIDVGNAAIYLRFGRGIAGIVWEAETFVAPGFRGLARDADAAQVRSAAPGHPAQVTLEAIIGG
jgi:hypothetical protein